MGWTEVFSELFAEFLPIYEFQVASIFFFPLEDSLSPFSSSSRFHI